MVALPKKPSTGDLPVAQFDFTIPRNNLLAVEGALVTGMSDWQYIQDRSQYMTGQEVGMFQNWATAHPTADPRVWVPLALEGVHPESPEGMQAAHADVVRQDETNEYGVLKGTPVMSLPQRTDRVMGTYAPPTGSRQMAFPGFQPTDIYPRPNETPEQRIAATPGGLAGTELIAGPMVASGMRDYLAAQEALANAPQPHESTGHRIWQDATWLNRTGMHLANLALSETPAVNRVYDIGKFYVRQVQTQFSFPFQFKTALERQIGGDTAYQDRIAKDLGLTGIEPQIAFRDPKVLDVEQRGTLPAGRYGGGTAFHIPAISSLPADRQAVVEQANAMWMATGRRINGDTGFFGPFRGAFRQTEFGQEIMDPRLFYQTVDPKTGEWVPEKGFFPNKVGQQRAEEEAAKAYNLLTAEQTAKHGGPVPWTWGRGIMGLWTTPDQTEFKAFSGIIDGLDNLFFDPMNLVPLGIIGKGVDLGAITAAKVARRAGVEVPTLTAEAFGKAAKRGPRILVSTSPEALAHAPEAATDIRRIGEVAAEQGGLTRVTDPALQAARDEETGVRRTPWGNQLVKEKVWNYLVNGRGARAVTWLANETSASRIIKASGGRIDAALALELKNAKTEEEVRTILAHRIGIDIRRGGLGKIGASGPALFKSQALLDSWGPVTAYGREKFRGNVNMLVNQEGASPLGARVASASAMYRGAFRLAPATIPLNLDDADVTYQQLTRWMGSARIPFEAYKDQLDRLLEARSGAERYDLLYARNNDGAVFSVAKAELEKQGLPPDLAGQVVTAYESGLDEPRRLYWNGDVAGGHGVGPDGLPTAVLETENLSKVAQLPDIRRIRRDINTLGKAVRITSEKVGLEDKGVAVYDHVGDALHGITTAWRGVTLARQAYSLREILESNIAMALNGYVSPMTHPFAFLSMVFSGMVADHIAKTPDLIAGALSGAYVRRAMIGSAKFTNAVMTSKGMQVLWPGFNVRQAQINGDAWGDSLQKVLDGSVDEVPKLFRMTGAANGNWQLDTQSSRSAARYAVPRSVMKERQQKRWKYLWAQKFEAGADDRTIRDLADPDLTPDQVANRFVESGMYRRMNYSRPDLVYDEDSADKHLRGLGDTMDTLALGDAKLRAVFHDKTFEGEPIFLNHRNREPSLNPKFSAYLQEKMDNPETRAMIERDFPVLHEGTSEYGKARWAKGVINDFFTSVAQWSDLFARGPLLRAAYTNKVLEVADELTPEARLQAIANLRKAGDVKLARRIMDRTRASKTGTIGVDDLELIAGGHAMREAQRVFYDAHQRQNWALATRVIAPFAQATFNTFRRWGEASMRNPQYMYRTLKPLEALMDPGSTAIYQTMSALTPGQDAYEAYWTHHDDSLNANGYFFTDTYGNRKFAYPVLGSLVNLFPHGPNVMSAPEGYLGGLNVAGNTWNPGVGPLVTLAESLVVPGELYKDNDVGSLLRMLNPYGIPEGNIATKVWDSFAPTWLRKLNDSSDPTAQANRTVKVGISLWSTQHYDRNDPIAMRKWLNDSKHTAWWLTIFDAFAGSTTPSTFNSEAMVKIQGARTDGDVEFLQLGKLAAEYRKYVTPLPGQDSLLAYQQGQIQFLKDFGDTALPATVSLTETQGPQATNDIWRWRAQNPTSYDTWAPVLGNFFANGSAANDFNLNLYKQQKRSDVAGKPERRNRTLAEVNAEADSRMGWLLWNARQKDFDAMDDDHRPAAKAQVKADIQAKYPGWTGEQKDPGLFEQNMEMMRKALDDPAIATLDSAPYIKYYLDTRDAAIAFLQKNYPKSSGNLTTKAALEGNVTAQVLNVAKALRAQDTSGGFTNFWTQLGSVEFRNVDVEG